MNSDPRKIFARVQPPEVADVCVIFFDEVLRLTDGQFHLNPVLKEQWIAGSRDWQRAYGVKESLLRRTMRHMREKELVIKSPRSCISIASDILHGIIKVPEVCPDCGEDMMICLHEWGAQKREEKYGGEW